MGIEDLPMDIPDLPDVPDEIGDAGMETSVHIVIRFRHVSFFAAFVCVIAIIFLVFLYPFFYEFTRTVLIIVICLVAVAIAGFMYVLFSRRREEEKCDSPIKPSKEFRVSYKPSTYTSYSGSKVVRQNRNDDVPDVKQDTLSEDQQIVGEPAEIETVSVKLQSIGTPAEYTFRIDGRTVAVIRPDASEIDVAKGVHKVLITARNGYRTVLFDSEVPFDWDMSFTVNKKEMGYSVRRIDLKPMESEPSEEEY